MEGLFNELPREMYFDVSGRTEIPLPDVEVSETLRALDDALDMFSQELNFD